MSVIYDALKKIKQTKEPDETVDLTSSPGKGNVLVFNKLLTRHIFVSVVILTVLIAFIGGALVYIYYDEIAADRTAESALPKTSQRPAASTSLNVETKRQIVTAPVSSSAPAGGGQSAKAGGNIVVSHIAPGQIPAEPSALSITNRVNAESVSTNDNQFTHSASSLTNFKIPKSAIEQHLEAKPKSAAAHGQRMRPAADKPTIIGKQIIPVLNKGNMPAGRPGTTNHESPLIRPAGDAAAVSRSVSGSGTIKASPRSVPASAGREKDISHSSEQKISQQHIKDLTQAFQVAVANHNYTGAGKVISRLGSLLGSEATYIKNLQAFLYLQKKEPARAKDILSSILRRDATDLEAGLNMIVVLVKEGDMKAARRRTTQLLDYYPDNQTLLHFKQQLDP